MAFTLNLTAKADVPESVIQEFDSEFMVALAESGAAAQFATIKKDFKAESIRLTKYGQLALAITPLVETDDVTSEKMQDSSVKIEPEEYGKVVTTTKLASLVTNGMADRASARIVGINAGRTDNKLAILALDASTNVIYADGAGTATIGASDIMTGSLMGIAFNKLSRKEVIGVASGDYIMLAHDDVIHDLRENSAENSWQDVNKYSQPETVLKNEVGKFKGLRVVRDNLCTIKVDAGAGGVDVYVSHVLGFNAFGKGVSEPISMKATGPFDKLSRFVNLGWYGVQNYKIVEQEALWTIESASSVGENA